VSINPSQVAIAPNLVPEFVEAVAKAGAELAPIGPEVGGLIWTDYHQPRELERVLEENPQLTWVQLPWAGVDAFADIIKRPLRFTSAKGSYREPVAEHALMLCMALGRRLKERTHATSWGSKWAVSLYDSNVVVVGGGGITEELLLQLKPFRANVTVIRKHPKPMDGAVAVLPLEALRGVLGGAQFVILACALTDETRGLFNADTLSQLSPEAYLVNVARGPIVDLKALVAALDSDRLAGAAIDVTDPEPLPEGHFAWRCKNLIITPHTADTPVQVTHFLAMRIAENTAAYLGRGPFVGEVNPTLGY
jgi:phosphoglycerate dehydrogenase-like enzyme